MQGESDRGGEQDLRAEQRPLEADVLVIGAGVAGLTASLDLAEAGRRVLLVDQATSHGGFMTLLDRQFPTDSCGFCQILPPGAAESDACLRSIFRHPAVTFSSATTVEAVEGEAGAFNVTLLRRATCVDAELCTHCGLCIGACPVTYPDPLQGGVVERKAIGYRAPLCAPSVLSVDLDHCTRCGACVEACPVGAVHLEEKDRLETATVVAVVLASGLRLHDPSDHPEYGYGRFPDVMTSLEFERRLGKGLLAGKEEVRRPSDGSVPARIAWIQCVGSREEGRSYCSSVCCMISLKEARLCRKILPEAHLELFYMDLRTCGKGYESYLDEARRLGVVFTRGRPGEVQSRDGRLWLHVEGEDGLWREEPFDMVILSVGFEAAPETRRLADALGIALDQDGFVTPEPGSLSRTGRDGVYVAGAVCEPRDIPESVMQAHEAAALAASHCQGSRGPVCAPPVPSLDPREEELRILVALCDCSGTLSSPDWDSLRRDLEAEPDVVAVKQGSYLCAAGGLDELRDALAQAGANSLVVGACSQRWLSPRLRQAVASLGLDPNLVRIVNLREQGAWVHGEERQGATARAYAEIRAAIAGCREYRPIPSAREREPLPGVLVVGGGPAGMSAAITLSELGHPVTLVESARELGGNLRLVRYGLEPGFRPEVLLAHLSSRLEAAPGVRVLTATTVREISGRPGAFRAVLRGAQGSPEEVSGFGAIVLATGAHMNTPKAYGYGMDERVMTQRELEHALAEGALDPRTLREVTMIQCVGSRDDEHPYCSRICCATALKNALRLLEGNPGLRVLIFYRDLRAFGTLERYYRRSREKGALFIPFDPRDPPAVEVMDGELTLTAWDPILGLRVRFRPEILVLSTGVIPDIPEDLLRSVGVSRDGEGFLHEGNPKFRPLDLRDGVYGCGLALGPAFLGEAMAQGRGAAIRAVAFLEGIKRVSRHTGARVEPRRCSACGLCVEACPFHARELDLEAGHAVVHEEVCQACGTCAAVCPNDATQLLGGTDRQVMAAIDALME